MTKMKVANIVEAAMVFGSNRYAKAEMDMNAAMWFMRNGKACGEVHAVFDSKRKTVFESFAIKNKEDKLEVPVNDMEAYQSLVMDLLDEEVEIEVVMIAVQALSTVQITPMDLSVIMFAISE